MKTRPVVYISFAFNYYFNRDRTIGYHIVNSCVHILTGVFLFLLINTTLNLLHPASPKESNHWIAGVAAFIWLIHPIQTQSVTYISQRMNSMAALFYILSMLFYARDRLSIRKPSKRVLYCCALVSGILAMGSKEIAATLPFFVFLYEWYFFRELSRSWLKRHLMTIFGITVGVMALFTVLSLTGLGMNPFKSVLWLYELREFTITQRLLTESRVVIYYLSLILFPHPSRLNLDHDFSLSYSLIQPVTTLISLTAIVALVGLAIYLAKKERLLSFCILWYLGNLVIESSILGLELIYEHRTYIPSMFFILMVVILCHRYIQFKWFKIISLCLLITALSFWTHNRNNTWRNAETFWEDCIKKSPKKARPYIHLGDALADQEKYYEAIIQYKKSLQLKPNHPVTHNNLGLAFLKMENYKEAESFYHKALRINPEYTIAHVNMGNVLAKTGNPDGAIKHYQKALQINPGFAGAHYNLAIARKQKKENNAAREHLLRVLEIDPAYTNAYICLGDIYFKEGNLSSAVQYYSKALRLDPGHSETYFRIGKAFEGKGNITEAIKHFKNALENNPRHADALFHLALIQAKQGDHEKAIKCFMDVIKVKPDYAEAYNNLGAVLAKRGNIKDAIFNYSKALRIKPDYADAHNNLGIALVGQGEIKKAARHFFEALLLKPGDKNIKQNLRRALQLVNASDEK